MKLRTKAQPTEYNARTYAVIAVLVVALLSLTARVFYLGVINKKFLEKESAIRSIRTVDIPAHRGMILDRNGVPLAISTAVDSVWVNPDLYEADTKQEIALAKLLDCDLGSLKIKTTTQNREFVYLKRHLPPNIAEQIQALNIPGVFLQQEYQRYYPEGEVTAHIIGFTNVDDNGQEGLELAYDDWLRGESGKKEVIKDRLGDIVGEIQTLSSPKPGHDLTLSVDSNIQYLAYRTLKETVNKFKAEAGSAIVLDVQTGEILAMVNQPSYNPNDRPEHNVSVYRNRAVTDLFEPGSTLKSFSIASALKSGKFKPDTKINTNPGWLMVAGKKVVDEDINHGILTVSGVLQKSSNIGVAKITLALPPENLIQILEDFGFGVSTLSGFPGEATGKLPENVDKRPFVLATLAFGYGVSVTPLQLARAYAIIGNGGKAIPVTFVKSPALALGKTILDTNITKQLLAMLETVLETGGSGTRGKVSGYKVAGKTGTAGIAGPNGYEKNKYTATFAGIAPLDNPRLVVVVMVKNPIGELHYGGLVAAPAFSTIMAGALRILDVPPDNFNSNEPGAHLSPQQQ